MIPKMHGATSIWVSSIILSIGKLDYIGLLASIALLPSLNSGHELIYKNRRDIKNLIIVSIFLILSSIEIIKNKNLLPLIYLIPLNISYLLKNDFRKYVLSASIIATLPIAFAEVDYKVSLLFISLSFAGVLVADNIIYNGYQGFVGLAIYSFMCILFKVELIIFILPLLYLLIKKPSLKIVGITLLITLLSFSIFSILILLQQNFYNVS